MLTLISTDDLDRCRFEPDLVIIDASYYLPTEAVDPQGEFIAARIPGAVFFDIESMSDPESALPHMLPTAEYFAAMVEALGVSNQSRIVVYDQRGLFSAARAWWMFHVFGHEAVQVLDGGLPKWRAEARALETGPAGAKPRGRFIPRFHPKLVRDRAAILANLTSKSDILLDARSAARFHGTVAEPRPGVRSGHVPGAVSIPFSDLLGPDHTMRAPDDLRKLFATHGVHADSQPVTMCGSGITGAVLTLGLARAGLPIGALYDGSWSDWGSATDTPIERS
jgi:thiosulfate/3-mercaptopyruvate sulfurtransferase